MWRKEATGKVVTTSRPLQLLPQNSWWETRLQHSELWLKRNAQKLVEPQICCTFCVTVISFFVPSLFLNSNHLDMTYKCPFGMFTECKFKKMQTQMICPGSWETLHIVCRTAPLTRGTEMSKHTLGFQSSF